MMRLFVWTLKAVLGVAQFAVLSRVAERTGFRSAWIYPISTALSRNTGLGEPFTEILLLVFTTCWLVWAFSLLCESVAGALGKVSYLGPSGQQRSHGSASNRQRI